MTLLSKTFADVLTLNRASVGSYYDANGVLQLAASGQPRLTHDPVTGEPLGILIEGQRTNLLLRSSEFDNAAWTKSDTTVTPNAVIAPDGTLTADKLVENNLTTPHTVNLIVTQVTGGVTYTYSIFAKAAERTIFRCAILGAITPRVTVDLVSGAITDGAAVVTAVGNGWWRIALTGTASSSMGLDIYMAHRTTSGGGTSSYPGDGTSGIYIWGAQLEVGAFPTSYIPTDATFVSRASTGTYFDSNGVMQTAGVNVARNGYKFVDGQWVSAGLLIEEQRTNLLTQSEALDATGWVKIGATIAANLAVAPDGLPTADKLVEDTSTGAHYLNSANVGVTNGATYTGSAFVKAAGRAKVYVTFTSSDLWTGSVNPACVLDLSTGAVSDIAGASTKALATPLGGGWFRISLTATCIGGGSSAMAFLMRTTTNTYTGDGTSGIYIGGAQLEAGSFPTSYIPTTTAQVTRAADVSTSTAVTRLADDVGVSTNFPWHRVEEGTWEIDIDTHGKAVRTLGYGDTFLADLVSGKGKVVVKYAAGVGSLWVAGAKLYEFQKEHGFDLSSLVKMAKGGGSTIEKALYTPHAKTDAEAAALATGNLVAVDKKVGPMVPSLSLDYVAGKYSKGLVDSDFNIHTFTRASAGSYWDKDGVLQQAASGQPRFDHDPVTGAPLGILIEEQRTNLLLRSSEFDDAYWSKIAVALTPNTAVAPDGTLTAESMLEDSANNFHQVGQITSSPAGTYTISVYAKYAGRRYVTLFPMNQGAVYTDRIIRSASFDLQIGTITQLFGSGTVATITGAGDGWYRLTCTTTTNSASTSGPSIRLSSSPAPDTGISYTGDGTSGIYIWGAQLEAGAFPTSYIPTPATFTGRGSTATYFDANGVLQTAASGVARSNAYGFDSTGAVKPIGLLLEGSASNLSNSTERLDIAAWTKMGSRITPNSALAPDGKLTACKITPSTSTGRKGVYKNTTALAPSTTYTLSVRVREAGYEYVSLGHNQGSGDVFTAANVRIDSGERQANGWFLHKTTFTTTATTPTLGIFVITIGHPNGVVGNDTSGIYIWGAQLETGSVATSYVPSTDTFTSRASTATYLDASGALQTAAVDVARSNAYAYDSAGVLKPVGLLLESAATNLLHSVTAGGTLGASKIAGVVSPDGSASSKVVENTETGEHRITQPFANPISVTTGSTYTASAYVKAGERRYVYALLSNVPSWGDNTANSVKFDLQTGKVLFTGSALKARITPAGSGWYRIEVTGTAISDSSASGLSIGISPVGTEQGGRDIYTGDGVSGFYIFGWQMETGSYATSYIPTTTSQVTRAADVSTSVAGVRAADVSTSSQVTRAADVCSVNTLSPWYNASEGSLVVSFSANTFTGVGQTSAWLQQGGFSGLRLYRQSAAILRVIWSTEDGLGDTITSSASALGNVKHAATYGNSGVSASSNGSAAVSSPALRTGFAPQALRIGRYSNSNYLNGHIRALRYYPRRLSDADLQTLTTP